MFAGSETSSAVMSAPLPSSTVGLRELWVTRTPPASRPLLAIVTRTPPLRYISNGSPAIVACPSIASLPGRDTSTIETVPDFDIA
jgi:hypothetical protein